MLGDTPGTSILQAQGSSSRPRASHAPHCLPHYPGSSTAGCWARPGAWGGRATRCPLLPQFPLGSHSQARAVRLERHPHEAWPSQVASSVAERVGGSGLWNCGAPRVLGALPKFSHPARLLESKVIVEPISDFKFSFQTECILSKLLNICLSAHPII